MTFRKRPRSPSARSKNSHVSIMSQLSSVQASLQAKTFGFLLA